MPRFNITKLDAGVTRAIKDLQSKSQSLRPVMEVIGSKINFHIQRGFRTSVDPWGKPWKQIKSRVGKPLVKRGLLRRMTIKADDSSVTIGTNLKQAKLQHFGGIVRPKTQRYLRFKTPLFGWVFTRKVVIPARPFLPINKQGNTDIPEYMAKDVMMALRLYFRKNTP